LNEPGGIITEKVPICRVTFSVTGLIPLLVEPRVEDSFRSKLSFAISSLAKEEAKGTSGVIAIWTGENPVENGEFVSCVRALDKRARR
jgi:hypothetical protein